MIETINLLFDAISYNWTFSYLIVMTTEKVIICLLQTYK
jgi:hypothetical protein